MEPTSELARGLERCREARVMASALDRQKTSIAVVTLRRNYDWRWIVALARVVRMFLDISPAKDWYFQKKVLQIIVDVQKSFKSF